MLKLREAGGVFLRGFRLIEKGSAPVAKETKPFALPGYEY
jgi:hypothetical protein